MNQSGPHRPSWLESWKKQARALKIQTFALYYAYQDPRVPWYAKVIAALVVAYAFSPIDLIPDFIPVLGYLDDLLIIPLGVSLVVKLIPSEVMQECRAKAEAQQDRPEFKLMAGVIILIWIFVLAWIGWTLYHTWRR